MDDDDDTFGSQDDNYDVKLKIMVIGESKTGKTSLISRYCNNEFSGGAYLSTIGIDFQIKDLNIKKKKIRVQIWDTAGQERYRNIAKNYFQSSDGFIIVYDISDTESFEKLDYWIEQIKTNAQECIKMILFGNKCDLINERKISREEGEEYAKNKNIKFFEVSAKDGTNVQNAFETFINEILVSFLDDNCKKRKSKVLSIPIGPPIKKKNCC